MKLITRGVVAGFAGTTVMTAAMLALAKAGMEPGKLEPGEVAENLEEAIGVRKYLPKRAFEATWVVLHFGYGGTSGAAYSVIREISDVDWPASMGAWFGVLLWAAGYCGWLPLFGLFPPPTRVPKRKVVANIVEHVIYGTATAMAHRLLSPKP